MTNVIDRRNEGKGASANNRRRFLERYKREIRKQVRDIGMSKDIKDLSTDTEDISVSIDGDMSEPTFVHKEGTGNVDRVIPGNDRFSSGDKMPKPQGGGQGSGGEASDQGGGEDSFQFSLTKDEFMDIFFEGMELPNRTKQKMVAGDDTKFRRAGFTMNGNPSSLNIIRTFRNSYGRRLALKSEIEKAIEDEKDPKVIEELEAKLKRIPFMEDIDVRFNNFEAAPLIKRQAVMFCLMDVSGSMGSVEKELAKKFFLLLSLFLEKNYDCVDLVFLRHAETAEEVDEQEFFYGRRSGGTVVSTVLELTSKIIDERYPLKDWNIYVAQASDGDNFDYDNEKVATVITEKLLTKVQYFAYVEVSPTFGSWRSANSKYISNLYKLYKEVAKGYNNMELVVVRQGNEIYEVFKKLFEKRDG